jgi:hypothetical protein
VLTRCIKPELVFDGAVQLFDARRSQWRPGHCYVLNDQIVLCDASSSRKVKLHDTFATISSRVRALLPRDSIGDMVSIDALCFVVCKPLTQHLMHSLESDVSILCRRISVDNERVPWWRATSKCRASSGWRRSVAPSIRRNRPPHSPIAAFNRRREHPPLSNPKHIRLALFDLFCLYDRYGAIPPPAVDSAPRRAVSDVHEPLAPPLLDSRQRALSGGAVAMPAVAAVGRSNLATRFVDHDVFVPSVLFNNNTATTTIMVWCLMNCRRRNTMAQCRRRPVPHRRI